LASLLATVIAVSHRSWPGVIQHVGLVIALVGIAVNQKAAHSDYLFLEQGAGASDFGLGRDLRRVEELPAPLALDSLTTVSAKAFRPAPVAWVTAADVRSQPVTYNRPLKTAGRQVLLSQTVAPGFLGERELGIERKRLLQERFGFLRAVAADGAKLT
jgi:hypothetical protein